jgi:hypothetical protein
MLRATTSLHKFALADFTFNLQLHETSRRLFRPSVNLLKDKPERSEGNGPRKSRFAKDDSEEGYLFQKLFLFEHF